MGEREHGAVFENLVGAGDIAVRLGFKRVQVVHGWLHTDGAGFPAPVRRINGSNGKGSYVWFWPDVEDWAWPRYADRIEEWRYSQGEEEGPAPGKPPPNDIDTRKVRT